MGIYLDRSSLLQHYKRDDICKAIVESAKDREIAVRFITGGFGKRPDVLPYPQDVLALAQQGASSFHASEERWGNPMHIQPQMTPKDVAELRIGWDLVIDIDSKFIEYTKIAADLVIKALKHHGVSSVSCKFSGGTGFHIGVPFEAFPDKVYEKETQHWFPDGPRAIALYLSHLITAPLREAFLAKGGVEGVLRATGMSFKDVVKGGIFDPLTVIGIDTLLISSRHLFRMAYSFNEKSGLVSVPVNPDKVLDFRKEIAVSKNVRISKFVFLGRDCPKGDAKQLMVQAFDFSQKQEEKKADGKRTAYEQLTEAIPEEFFPHCIKKIFAGLTDGRKRAVFILINFLRSVGWSYDVIESRLREWNAKNSEPVREVILVGQLRYHKARGSMLLPPNCSNASYYADMGVKCSEDQCARFKNPAAFAKAQVRFLKNKKPAKSASKKKESSKAPTKKYINEVEV